MVTLLQEAERTLPAAISAGQMLAWAENFIQKGLGYDAVMTVLMGGRSVEEVRGEAAVERLGEELL